MGRDGNGYSGTGYLFDIETGSQLAKLSAFDSSVAGSGIVDTEGSAVALDGNWAVVGSTVAQAAYVFEHDGQGGWDYVRTLVADDAGTGDAFGTTLAIHGDVALVGAPGDTNANGFLAGAAYFFDITTGEQLTKVTASDGESFDLFGSAVGLGGSMALVGASFDITIGGNETGSAYVFEGPTLLASDFNKSGSVDDEDLDLWQAGFGSMGASPMDGDADEDGDVDGLDFLTWQLQLGLVPTTPVVAAVPEPGAAVLGLTAGFLLASRMRLGPEFSRYDGCVPADGKFDTLGR